MPVLSFLQIAQLVRDVGITGENAVIAVAVTQPESSRNTTSSNITPSTGDDSHGLWQINIRPEANPQYGPKTRLFDPRFNAQAMHDISNGGTKWSPWGAFRRRLHLPFMDDARAALAQLGNSGVLPSPAGGGAVEVPALAPPEPAITPPPTATLVAGLGLYGPSDITLEGQKLGGLARVLTASLERSIDEASTINLDLADPHGKLLRSGLLEERFRTTIDGIVWENGGSRRSGTDINLNLVDAAAADLINDMSATDLKQAANSGSRGDFMRRLIERHPWIPFDIETGAVPALELTVDEGESVWQALGRHAGEVGWRRCAVANRVLIGSDEWLASRGQPFTISENTPGIDRIEFDFVVGEKAATASVTADVAMWAAPPSQAVIIEDLGPASGEYLCERVSSSFGSTQTRVQLTRPSPPLPEPVPSPEPEAYDDPLTGTGAATVVPVGATSAQGVIWPITGRVSSEFGPRGSPGGIGSSNHAGIDIAAPRGTPIAAAAAGTVTHAGTAGGYGNAVYIHHGGGTYSRYGHMQRTTVTRGQQVAQGQQIGLCNSTGSSTGDHVHFEWRPNDRPVNPRTVLPSR